MNGRKVETLFAEMVSPDSASRFEFDRLGLANGIYLYRLTTTDEVDVERENILLPYIP